MRESIVAQVPVQVRVGEACANLDAAELLFGEVMRDLHAAGEAGEEIAGERLLRLRRLNEAYSTRPYIELPETASNQTVLETID